MADPLFPITLPPVPGLERVGSLLGNLSRPYMMYAIGTAEALAIARGHDAGVIAAGGFVAITIYGARALENHGAAKQEAQVKIAEVNATATGAAT